MRCCPRSRRRQRGTPCQRKIPPDKTRWDLLRIDTVVSPRRASGGDPSETRFRVAMPSTWTVGRGAHTPPNQAAGITGPAVGIAGQFGRIYNPPLQAYPLPFSVVGAACMAARTAPAGPPGLRAWQPAPRRHVGMPPYGVGRGRGGNRGACQGGYTIRPYRRGLLPFPAVGAHCICAHAAPPGFTRPAIIAPRPRRHVGMPPYGVRRGYGGNRGPFRAADSRPYGCTRCRFPS